MANTASEISPSTVNPVVGSAISAGSGFLGGVISAGANLYEAKKQREWFESMQDKQNQWSLDMWNRTNEYNSPSAQVERLRSAGLNPLYYGLDGSSANGLESAQSLGYERAQFGATENPVAMAYDAMVKNAQIANIQANTAKQSEETLSEIQRREKVSAEIDVAKQELENMKATEKLTEAQTEDINKRIGWLDRLNEANLAKTQSEKALNEATKRRIEELLEGEKLIQSKTLDDFDKKWAKIDEEIKKISKETGLLALDIENYALNHASNGFMGTGLSFQNFIRAFKGKKFVPEGVDITDSESVYNGFGNTD